jgi:putative hydrolase of the HAD superfamily
MSERNGLHPQNASPIRAVILDYGEVLCHRPTPEEIDRMASVFQMNREEFVEAYTPSRNPYDQGVISTEDYWREFARKAGIGLDEAIAEQLPLWDIEMWSRINPSMVAWLESLHNAGLRTAILSNMTYSMKSYMLATFDWLRHFDCHVFSCDIHVIKPDAGIYQHCLECLGSKPEETLFVDDREVNAEGARAVGIRAIRFHSVEQLKKDLEMLNFPISPKTDLNVEAEARSSR